jgi:Rrf2 family protein
VTVTRAVPHNVLDAATWVPHSASRGTVIVLVGRGEHPGVYARLGRRLAFDGYTVVVPDAAASDAYVATELTARKGARILLGSDIGAVRAWSLALAAPAPDALVLAGLPLAAAAAAPTDRDAELAVRTACPIHRSLLMDDPDFRWGALGSDVPPTPDALPEVPVLLLHGEADPLAPVEPVRALVGAQAELAVVRDGVHDVLNDQFHRIVSARLVQFLEGVVKGAGFAEPPVEIPAAEPARARRAAPLHISARLDYAMRAMAELVIADSDRLVRSEALAHAQDIPLNSLVNIMIQLRRAGVVTSRRGREGGYQLARPASQITVADVVRATEGAIANVRPDGPAGALWTRLEQVVRRYLEDRSVLELATTPEKRS